MDETEMVSRSSYSCVRIQMLPPPSHWRGWGRRYGKLQPKNIQTNEDPPPPPLPQKIKIRRSHSFLAFAALLLPSYNPGQKYVLHLENLRCHHCPLFDEVSDSFFPKRVPPLPPIQCCFKEDTWAHWPNIVWRDWGGGEGGGAWHTEGDV